MRCSDWRSGVCYISPLLRVTKLILPFDCSFADARIEVVEGSLLSWNKPRSLHSSADATGNLSFRDSVWNKCCVSLELSGALRLCGTLGAQG